MICVREGQVEQSLEPKQTSGRGCGNKGGKAGQGASDHLKWRSQQRRGPRVGGGTQGPDFMHFATLLKAVEGYVPGH